MAVDVKYRTNATATGARESYARTADGTLNVRLVVPEALGGPGGDGVDPEKLFAAGYSACFLSALRYVAGQEKISIPTETKVTADIGLGPRGDGGFGLTASLTVDVPGMHTDIIAGLVEKAHFVCAYSHVTRDHLDLVTLIV